MGYLQRLVEKWKCRRGKHDWGPKNRYSMYSYVEACKREGCNIKRLDSSVLIYTDENGQDWGIQCRGARKTRN